MSKFSDKVEAFQNQVWEFSRHAEKAYEMGNFQQAVKWIKSKDAAIVSRDYWERLHLEELASYK